MSEQSSVSKSPTPPTPETADSAKDHSAALSQSQLIRLRFFKHKAAVLSLFVLVILYGMSIFAEFVAVVPSSWRNLDYAYCPPQLMSFDFEHGLHAKELQRHIDPVTNKNYFTKSIEGVVPLGLFVRGEPYHLFGLIPWDRHLIGVDLAALERDPEKYALEGDPVFYFLGADRFGYDIWSRMIFGARISLTIGLVAIAFTFVIGVVIGGISGYLGGVADTIIQRVIEIINAFPHIPIWLAIGAILPQDWSPLRIYFAMTILLSLLNWTGLARVVRGKILSLREEDYATAARLLGASHSRVIFRHLVPGFTTHILVSLTLSVPAMILGETALSFLGLGLRPPVVSWGVMLQETIQLQVIANYPWLLMPVAFIVLTVLAFNFLGDGLRDAADPYGGR